MEKIEFPTREELKIYFETGKHPTQGQFSDLIDSLKHKEDLLTNKELVTIANSLATLDNAYIEYYINNVGDLKFPIVVASQDEEESVIELWNNSGNETKQYYFGNPPYTITAKEFPMDGLAKNEYYFLYWQVDENNQMQRLFGNNLNTIPDGFELGRQKGKRFYFQLTRQNLVSQINVVNTKIRFINNTDMLVQYRAFSGNWGDRFRTEDTITDHYHLWDYLFFYYNADLRDTDQTIECKIYNADNDQLLLTNYLYAGQNNENVGGGNLLDAIRNIRIECDYYENLT